MNKKGVFIVFHSKLRWPSIWGKLNHIWRVLLNKPLTFESYIAPEDLEELERR